MAIQDRAVFKQIIADAYAVLDVSKPETYHGQYDDIIRRLIAGEWTACQAAARGGVQPLPLPAPFLKQQQPQQNQQQQTQQQQPQPIPQHAYASANGKKSRRSPLAQLATTATSTTSATPARG